MSTIVYNPNIECIFSTTLIKQLAVLTLSDIFRLMSGPVKPVFASPTGLTPEHTVSMGAPSLASGSLIDNLITRSVMFSANTFRLSVPKKYDNFRHSFPDDVSKAQTSVQREEHAKRMKSLRKELEYLDKTNWQYEPIEKLIGQS